MRLRAIASADRRIDFKARCRTADAEAVGRGIERHRVMMDTLFLLAMNGLIWGLIIALIALGLSIIFGLLDIINLAHGDFFMVGTVLAWATLQATGNFWLAFHRRAADRLHSRSADPARRDPAHPQRRRAVDRRDLRPLADPAGKRAHHVRADAGPDPAADHRAPFRMFGIEYEVYRLFAAAVAIVALVGFFLFLQHTTARHLDARGAP